VAKAPGDGYTLVVGTVGTHAINPALYEKMSYNNIKDFTPISFPGVDAQPAGGEQERAGQQREGADRAGEEGAAVLRLLGSGTSIHLSGELFNTLAGVKMQHIPYKGRAEAIPDLLGGRIQMIFDNMPSALPLVQSGELKAIAVTSAQRSAAAPQIPTIAESGLPGFEATSWFALLARARPAARRADAHQRRDRSRCWPCRT
jgi:tripartite-type tricarboxylate transporter receptor subunit TctC